jgi:glycosyltransferase involved in cell wall biosynthesis
MSISVLILTLNEEINLPACLESVKWSNDIVVFDSNSTDRTVEIAQQAGVRVVQRCFDNYAAQRNAALQNVGYNHDWILMLDADERVTPELRIEIQNTVQRVDGKTTLFRFCRKDMFCGRWLRHSSGYPTWFGRLIRKGRVQVLREINEEYHTDGHIGFLKEHLIHFPFNKGVAFWFERHNRYSTMEAEIIVEQKSEKFSFTLSALRDPVIRRKAFKKIAYSLPFRPLIVFVYLYIIRMGFLDGVPGLFYCILRTIYEFMIDLKVKELKNRGKDLSF